MKVQKIANQPQAVGEKQAPAFGNYSVYKNSSGYAPMKDIAKKVPTAFVHFDEDILIVVPGVDMAFYARLKTAVQKSAFMNYLFSRDNAPLITAKDLKEGDIAGLLKKVTMDEEKFRGFLATLTNKGEK